MEERLQHCGWLELLSYDSDSREFLTNRVHAAKLQTSYNSHHHPVDFRIRMVSMTTKLRGLDSRAIWLKVSFLISI